MPKDVKICVKCAKTGHLSEKCPTIFTSTLPPCRGKIKITKYTKCPVTFIDLKWVIWLDNDDY